jgi:hypothetical protein
LSNFNPAQQNVEPSEDQLSIETLVEKVHSGFNSVNRERISRELIEQTLSTLDLSVIPSSQAAPRLVIERLIFEGEKQLRNESGSQPIRYDQRFESGVNILLVPRCSRWRDLSPHQLSTTTMSIPTLKWRQRETSRFVTLAPSQFQAL